MGRGGEVSRPPFKPYSVATDFLAALGGSRAAVQRPSSVAASDYRNERRVAGIVNR